MAGDSKPAPANESKDKTDAAAAQPAAQPQLSALEEDDEFEEFPAQDWDDSATELLNLKGGPPGAAKSGGDRLWEDNWDDDDIEEDFNLQLRNEIAKTSAPGNEKEGEAMQH